MRDRTEAVSPGVDVELDMAWSDDIADGKGAVSGGARWDKSWSAMD